MLSDNESVNSSHDGDIPSEEEETQNDAPLENEAPEGEAQEAPDDDKSKKVVKPKRILKYPRPKFDEHTLKTPKGLQAIKGHFQDFEPKGKGYEDKDLNAIIKRYEYWCHRLYPKFTFDDTIERLEVLGNRKATTTYLTRIRMGLESSVEEEKALLSDDEALNSESLDDQFDKVASDKDDPQLTEEQLRIIEESRKRALELRKAKMSKVNDSVVSEILNETGTDENEEMDLDNMLKMVNDDSNGNSEEVIANARLSQTNSVTAGTNEGHLNENSDITHKKPVLFDDDSNSSDALIIDTTRVSNDSFRNLNTEDTSDSNSPEKFNENAESDEEIVSAKGKRKRAVIESDSDD
ncbi:unnamed protein product [Phyllotreta striolata]|uniref:TIMELESS-interacting protein n=1 Tax=Phyllotreta striolata TaxID=444603 RepID=A0A9N9XQJ3_PHYSR|nr:unnamed protein product [Phyllotreta striolata]